MADTKAKSNFQFWAEELKQLPPSYAKWFQEEGKYLLARIAPQSKVLEVGCGNGRTINDIVPATQDIIGIDHDPHAVQAAKQNLAGYSIIQIIQADAANLPFHDDNFDFVVCMGSFVNFAEKKLPALLEMKRVVRPSGKIILSVFSENAFNERKQLYKKMGDLYSKIKEVKGTTVVFDESLGDNVSEQFSERQLRDIFSQANLKIEDISNVGIAYLCTLSKAG